MDPATRAQIQDGFDRAPLIYPMREALTKMVTILDHATNKLEKVVERLDALENRLNTLGRRVDDRTGD